MQFITSLFGGSGNSVLTSIFALGIVLVLIVLGLWALKMLFKASSNVARGRNRRLLVVDTLAIDPKRQLVIIRRDNVEHLLLTGGPQDVVVETGIPVSETPQNVTSRRPLPNIVANKTAGRPTATTAKSPGVAANQQSTLGHAPAPVATTPKVSPLDRLRELRRPSSAKNPTSVRQTGLMRPVSKVEPTALPAEKTNGQAADSVKEAVNTSTEQNGRPQVDDSGSHIDDKGYSADRN
ncbi:flagellar biosynthetic protein FliO [Devosia rhodophyticola]|uniref:Flagellar biosynthetic protein FliO n=1 Tax=Devosia rhodophyticola TaxID=3026423 RepID=A0ABY7YWG6_9HYPH|nr:flagellar biosynthetic protein FliO [Devosia rhodophyticola]WDR05428.1 flagellar biosynthetic protein FliO [Devosia rhodophyticola]